MTWETIESYLSEIARLCKVPHTNVVLARYEEGSRIVSNVVITAHNWNHGYLKPDVGYGAKLNKYAIKDAGSGTCITSFGLYEFPSCCAFCVSTQAWVHEKYRRLGINKLTNKLRQDLAREAGYSAMICTDVVDNEGERRTLMANGFLDIFTIQNKRTGNYVAISVKTL